MKNVQELGDLIGSLINAGFKSLEDKKLNLQDLANFLDPIFKAQPAIDGIGLVGRENAEATVAEREAVKKSFSTQLNSVQESDRYDLSEVFSGFLAAYRMGYKIGNKDGEQGLIADLVAGKVTIEDLRERFEEAA